MTSATKITSQAQFEAEFAPLCEFLAVTEETEGTWTEIDDTLARVTALIQNGGHRANSFIPCMEKIADKIALSVYLFI